MVKKSASQCARIFAIDIYLSLFRPQIHIECVDKIDRTCTPMAVNSVKAHIQQFRRRQQSNKIAQAYTPIHAHVLYILFVP